MSSTVFADHHKTIGEARGLFAANTLQRSGHSRPAKSFETPHPLNVIQVLYFLERRQIGEVDPGHRAASSFADGGQDTLAPCSLPSARQHQPHPILDERSERSSLCSGLAFGAVKQIFGESDSGSLRHMSKTYREVD